MVGIIIFLSILIISISFGGRQHRQLPLYIKSWRADETKHFFPSEIKNWISQVTEKSFKNIFKS